MGWLFQRQPEPNVQRQYVGPAPGPTLRPAGSKQLGVIAPLAQNNSTGGNANGARNIGGPGRSVEQQLQDASATPLNGYLAAVEPIQVQTVYRHTNRIRTGSYRDFPRSYNGWTNRAAFVGPNTVGYGRRAIYQGASSPVQLQLSPGGLIINSYANAVKNINTNLAPMYSGARAPLSSSYSGGCS